MGASILSKDIELERIKMDTNPIQVKCHYNDIGEDDSIFDFTRSVVPLEIFQYIKTLK